MSILVALAGLYVLGLALGMFIILRATSRTDAAELRAMPSSLDLYVSIVASLFKPKKATKASRIEGLQVLSAAINAWCRSNA
jgi:hypothetical protein